MQGQVHDLIEGLNGVQIKILRLFGNEVCRLYHISPGERCAMSVPVSKGIKMVSRVYIPSFILTLVIIDLTLGIAYILNALAGLPYRKFTIFLDLNGEANLPTWYSSIKWFCVATLLGIFAHHNVTLSQRKSWLLATLPLVFLALSLDEVAQIHEWLGRKSDILLPRGSREHTLFSRTGIWMFVIGIPFLVFFMVLIFSVWSYFQRAPTALVKVLLGMAITLAGAIGIETLSNFVARNSVYSALQILLEEWCEMLGATIVLWGSYELLYRHGFAFRLDRAEIDQSPPPRSPRQI